MRSDYSYASSPAITLPTMVEQRHKFEMVLSREQYSCGRVASAAGILKAQHEFSLLGFNVIPPGLKAVDTWDTTCSLLGHNGYTVEVSLHRRLVPVGI